MLHTHSHNRFRLHTISDSLSTDGSCSTNWMMLLEAKFAGFTKAAEFKSWLIPAANRKPFQCIGIKIESSFGTRPVAALTAITMWEWIRRSGYCILFWIFLSLSLSVLGRYRVDNKKVFRKSEEKMHKKVKMTLQIAKNLVYVKQHYGVSFCKKIFFRRKKHHNVIFYVTSF